MTTYPLHLTDNANSWRRVFMLAHLYWPILRRGFIIYSIVPALLYFLAAFLGKNIHAVVAQFVLWPINIMLYLAPVMLTRRNCRCISAQLPTTAAEKMGFLLMTFWIVVPAIVLLSEFIGNCIGVLLLDCSTYKLIETYQELQLAETPITGINAVKSLWWVNIFSYVTTSAIILYYVVTSRNNRVLAGILSYFVTTFASGFLTVFVTLGYTLYRLSAHAEMHMDMLMSLIKVSLFTVVISLLIAGTIYFVRLYKYLRNGGF